MILSDAHFHEIFLVKYNVLMDIIVINANIASYGFKQLVTTL